MAEKMLVIDIEPKAKNPGADGAQKRLWTRSDNSFQFNFITRDSSTTTETDMSSTDGNAPPVQTTDTTVSTGQGSGFAFNFQIPTDPPEDTETQAAPQTISDSQGCAKDKTPVETQKDSPTSEPLAASKAKKKKKSKKKKDPETHEGQKKEAASIESSSGDAVKEMTAEEQLNRELDWCIEQLEQGMKTQKGTPKQKEEVSRALKTLRSSKAPLAKKRQVMRSMTGDYRKKMLEERNKQFKLIENAMTSAQVKSVSNPSKKSVFHRKADSKTQTPDAELRSQRDSDGKTPNADTLSCVEASSFVFTPSNEEFCFNFL